ncbi:hypothetical protein [Gilliamella sp. B2772]|nr:hypothetical protein [Gilliamella sp. B2772]
MADAHSKLKSTACKKRTTPCRALLYHRLHTESGQTQPQTTTDH